MLVFNRGSYIIYKIWTSVLLKVVSDMAEDPCYFINF